MEEKQLQQFIDELTKDVSKDDALISIEEDPEDEKDDVIPLCYKVNHQGLKLHIAELTKILIAKKDEKSLAESFEYNDSLFSEASWYRISRVAYRGNTKNEYEKEKSHPKWKDNLMTFLFWSLIMFVLFSVFIGIKTMFGWLFS